MMSKLFVIQNTLSFGEARDAQNKSVCTLAIQAKSLLMKKLRMWALPVTDNVLIVPEQNVDRVIAATEQVAQRFGRLLNSHVIEYCVLSFDKFLAAFIATMPETYNLACRLMITTMAQYMQAITKKSRLRQTTLDNLFAIYVALNSFNLLDDVTQNLPIILGAKVPSVVKMKAIEYVAKRLSGQTPTQLEEEAFTTIIRENPPVLPVSEVNSMLQQPAEAATDVPFDQSEINRGIENDEEEENETDEGFEYSDDEEDEEDYYVGDYEEEDYVEDSTIEIPPVRPETDVNS